MAAEETPQRIEPTRPEETPEAITDVIADLSAASARLGKGLHPLTAANLADLVRLMNTYYSNLIEGHNTRPKDIARALEGEFDKDEDRRNLQLEAAAHVRVQVEIDRRTAAKSLPETGVCRIHQMAALGVLSRRAQRNASHPGGRKRVHHGARRLAIRARTRRCRWPPCPAGERPRRRLHALL